MNSSYMDRSYPLFRRNLKLEAFYKKVEEKNSRSFLRRKISKKALVWLFAVFVFALSTPVIVDRLQKIQELRSLALQAPKSAAIETELGTLSGGTLKRDDFIASGGDFVDLGTNAGGAIDLTGCPSLPLNSGQIDLTVQIPYLGTYFYWSRLKIADERSNSYYLQVDSQCPIVVGGTPLPLNTWTWVNSKNVSVVGGNRIIFDLSVGPHTVSIVSRDQNVMVDRIIFTTDPKCIPVLKGDNCL